MTMSKKERNFVLSYYIIITLFTFSFIKKYNNCYCIQYAVIMKKKKKKKFPKATNFITRWSWQKYIILFQHDVYYALITIKKLFFSFQYYFHYVVIMGKKFTIATTPATFVIITNLFSLLLLRLLRCDHDQKNMYFYYSTTSTTPWSRLKIYLFSFQH